MKPLDPSQLKTSSSSPTTALNVAKAISALSSKARQKELLTTPFKKKTLLEGVSPELQEKAKVRAAMSIVRASIALTHSPSSVVGNAGRGKTPTASAKRKSMNAEIQQHQNLAASTASAASALSIASPTSTSTFDELSETTKAVAQLLASDQKTFEKAVTEYEKIVVSSPSHRNNKTSFLLSQQDEQQQHNHHQGGASSPTDITAPSSFANYVAASKSFQSHVDSKQQPTTSTSGRRGNITTSPSPSPSSHRQRKQAISYSRNQWSSLRGAQSQPTNIDLRQVINEVKLRIPSMRRGAGSNPAKMSDIEIVEVNMSRIFTLIDIRNIGSLSLGEISAFGKRIGGETQKLFRKDEIRTRLHYRFPQKFPSPDLFYNSFGEDITELLDQNVTIPGQQNQQDTNAASSLTLGVVGGTTQYASSASLQSAATATATATTERTSQQQQPSSSSVAMVTLRTPNPFDQPISRESFLAAVVSASLVKWSSLTSSSASPQPPPPQTNTNTNSSSFPRNQRPLSARNRHLSASRNILSSPSNNNKDETNNDLKKEGSSFSAAGGLMSSLSNTATFSGTQQQSGFFSPKKPQHYAKSGGRTFSGGGGVGGRRKSPQDDQQQQQHGENRFARSSSACSNSSVDSTSGSEATTSGSYCTSTSGTSGTTSTSGGGGRGDHHDESSIPTDPDARADFFRVVALLDKEHQGYITADNWIRACPKTSAIDAVVHGDYTIQGQFDKHCSSFDGKMSYEDFAEMMSGQFEPDPEVSRQKVIEEDKFKKAANEFGYHGRRVDWKRIEHYAAHHSSYYHGNASPTTTGALSGERTTSGSKKKRK